MSGANHPLTALLEPKRIALVGASAKVDSVGQGIIQATSFPGTPAEIFLVNPSYREIDGRKCHARIGDIANAIDMAVLAVSNERLEQSLIDAIDAKVKAVTIFASGQLAEENEPKLAQRIAARAKEAGVAICGGNCMGFYNLAYGLRVCGFPPPSWLRAGGAVLLTHSGSVFSALCHNDRRMAWSLVVSSGQELTTTIADYLDFALESPKTRCVGIFMEMARDPDKFAAALAKADRQGVPVIALKVGKTEASAKRAISHSGAIAGNHAAYRALFDRHHVIEVDNLDDFANALRLHSGPRRIGAGGLATIHDSGGLLELTVDRGQHHRVRFADISPTTKKKLAARLDPGLEPANPLDAWGTGRDYVNAFSDMMRALLEDPDTALAMMCAETRDGYYLSEGYATVLRNAFRASDKPVLICSNFGSHGNDGVAQTLSEEGIPSLSGVDSALAIIAKSLRRVERLKAPRNTPQDPPAGLRAKWSARLQAGQPLSESESLDLLADYGLTVAPRRLIQGEEDLPAAAQEINGPWALKTAMPNIFHKTEVRGVVLDIDDIVGLKAAYKEMAARLGPTALVAPMLSGGLELALGGIVDPAFGPLVMVGAGGQYIELFQERAVALAPIDQAGARQMIDELSFQALLRGWRGGPPANVELLAHSVSRLSVMLADLSSLISEIDINPILVGPDRCIALDALVAPAVKERDKRWM